MRRGGLAIAGLLALVLPVAAERAEAAVACPAECRRELSNLLCRTETIVRADGSSFTIYYYWSSGR